MKIDTKGSDNEWWWNLDRTINRVVCVGIHRLLKDGQHLWTVGEREDLETLVREFAGHPTPEHFALLGKYANRLWD